VDGLVGGIDAETQNESPEGKFSENKRVIG
jgi:hypothetical protein